MCIGWTNKGLNTINMHDATTKIIHSTLRTAPYLFENVSLAVLFGSNGNSYTVGTQSYIHMLFTILDACRAKEINENWDSSECCAQRTSFRVQQVRQPLVLDLNRFTKLFSF